MEFSNVNFKSKCSKAFDYLYIYFKVGNASFSRIVLHGCSKVTSGVQTIVSQKMFIIGS